MRSRRIGETARRSTRAVTVAVLSVVLVTGGALLAAPAGAADVSVTGTVNNAATSAVISGAFVAIRETGGSSVVTATRSAPDGSYAISLAEGSYTVSAQAPGYAVSTTSLTVVTGMPAADLTLTASGTKFRDFPVFGGQVGGLVAGGPGEFYLSTSVIPQVFRTIDYGGTWSPVTVGYDDATNGLTKTMNLFRGSHLLASGSPGEVAVLLGVGGTWRVFTSVDYGVGWSAVGGGISGGPDVGGGLRLGWGHAGATSVILVATAFTDPALGATNYVVDMNAATPTLTAMTTPYAEPDDAFAVANGSTAPYVAVARQTSGDLDVIPLTATTSPGAAASALAAFRTSPSQVVFGGASTGTSPSMIAVVSSAANSPTRVAVKGAAVAAFAAVDASASTDANTAGPGGRQCVQPGGPTSGASVRPGAASGASIMALLSKCLVTFDGTAGGALTFSTVNGSNGQMVFDSGFDGSGDKVVLATDGARGVIKASTFDATGPVFNTAVDASAGTASGSAGIAVDGLTVPVVKGVALGPDATGAKVATIVSPSGGGLSIASTNSGSTFTTVVKKGGYASAWWQGTSSHWLLFGHSGAGNLLTAREGWTAAAAPLLGPNVNLTDASIAGGNVYTLLGMAGSDDFFLGGEAGGQGTVGRWSLSGSGDVVSAATAATPASRAQAVLSLAYCPAGSATSVADTLFVGTGSPQGGASGGLSAVASASTATDYTGTATGLPTTAPVNALAVDCTNGVVWAGTGSSNVGGLYKSSNGGTTFSSVPVFGGPSANVTALAINTADPNEVVVAANAEGMIARTLDAGASWTLVNDPGTTGRSFMSEGVRALSLPPAAGISTSGGLSPEPVSLAATAGSPISAMAAAKAAVVGTGGGLLAGSLRAASTRGIFGSRRTGTTAWPAVAKVTPSTSLSATPVVAVGSDNRAHLAFKGTDGIYYSSRTSTASAWSTAVRITGTSAADSQPAIATRGSAVYVAYRRGSGSVGIYVSMKATTTWSSLGRATSVTSAAGPTLGVDGVGTVHLAWTVSTGIGYRPRTPSAWGTSVRLPGSAAGSTSPSLVVNPSGTPTVRVAFKPASAPVVLATRAPTTGLWSTAAVAGSVAVDVSPSLARDSLGKLYVAVRRPSGTTPGIILLTNATGTWVTRRITTVATDISPTVAVTGGTLQTAYVGFVRPTGMLGVYTVRVPISGALSTTRVTTTADLRPDVAVEAAAGKTYVVFAR